MKQTLGRIAAGLLGQASNATLSFFSNNRTDSTGVDLNRRWDCPSKEMEPSLYWTKELLRKIDGEDGRSPEKEAAASLWGAYEGRF